MRVDDADAWMRHNDMTAQMQPLRAADAGCGNGQEPMSGTNAARRMDHAALLAHESALEIMMKTLPTQPEPDVLMTTPQDDTEMRVTTIDTSAPRIGKRRQKRKKPQGHWTPAKSYHRKL